MKRFHPTALSTAHIHNERKYIVLPRRAENELRVMVVPRRNHLVVLSGGEVIAVGPST